MKRTLLILCLALQFAYAQNNYQSYLTDKTSYREHSLDITHMKVEVSFKPIQGKVIGKVSHSFIVLQKQVDSVFFDGPGITIKSAMLNGTKLNYTSNKQGVWVKPEKALKWDEKGVIVFEYEAQPKRGIYFIGWKDTVGVDPSNPFSVRKQIWTQGQGIDNRHWIPMYDDMNDKFITETVIRFDKQYQVLSNGMLLKKTEVGNEIVWNYTMTKPHAGYLLMLGIGKYAVITGKSGHGVPLNNWYYPEFKERAEPTYRYTSQMMDFLEDQTGVNYPWESYSQIMVQDFIYGAMENTTATIFGDFFNVDERAFPDRNYVGVNAHEMTHQWFGDFITARDARDSWLQESFATYWPKQFSKVNEGVEEWDWQRRGHQNAAIEAGKKDNYPVRHTQGGTARNYPKGAAVISMLEYVLGEEQWKRALNHYLKQHAYANVETNDLKQAIQDKLGKDLSWFFDEWILRGGEPHYRVHYEDLTYNDGSRATEIAIEQIHKTDETVKYFTMPVVIEVYYTDGSKDVANEQIDEAFEVVKIANQGKKQIDYVLFDPNSNIIKQVTFKKSFDELKSQAIKAQNMLDRYDAVVALKEFPVDQKRRLLLEVLSKEKHHGIKSEIISQLSTDTNEESKAVLKSILKDVALKSNIRIAVINGLKVIDEEWKSLLFMAMKDGSYDVMKAAMDKLVQLSFDATTMEKLLESSKGVFGMNNAIAIRHLEIKANCAMAFPSMKIEHQKVCEELIKYSSSVYEFRTRILAFNSIKALNLCDESVVRNLFQAMLSPNGRLASPAAQTAEYLAGQTANKQMMITYYNKSNFTMEDKDLLKKQLNILQ